MSLNNLYIDCAHFANRLLNELKLFLYRCTVHFDIYKVHTPTNALFIKPDNDFKIYIKNHFDLLLHVSVHDRHQGAFTRA